MTTAHRLSTGVAVVLGCLAAASVPARAEPAPRLVHLGAQGGDFRAALSDGRVLKGADLVGATLDLAMPDGTSRALRIDSAEQDRHPEAPDVWLFAITVAQPDGTWRPFCEPDPDGRELAIPYPDPAAPGGLALTCTSGAVGKCFRFGYRPWANAPDGTPLAPYHAACVRMVRADYGGDGRPWTRNGMRTDLYDGIGIQNRDEGETMPFEAGWTPNGAVCVAHARVPENGSLADIAAAEPILAGRTGPETCNEASARALGALLLNRSEAPR